MKVFFYFLIIQFQFTSVNSEIPNSIFCKNLIFIENRVYVKHSSSNKKCAVQIINIQKWNSKIILLTLL